MTDAARLVRAGLPALHQLGPECGCKSCVAHAALRTLVDERDEALAKAEAAEAERLAYAKASLDQLDRHRAELGIVIETRQRYVSGWMQRAGAAEAGLREIKEMVESSWATSDGYNVIGDKARSTAVRVLEQRYEFDTEQPPNDDDLYVEALEKLVHALELLVEELGFYKERSEALYSALFNLVDSFGGQEPIDNGHPLYAAREALRNLGAR